MYGGRIYTLGWDAATGITAQIDVWEIVPAADKPLFVHEIKIWQTSDFGDTAEEIIGLSIFKKHSTSGSTGGTPVARKKYEGDAAISATIECRNTTIASGGSPEETPLDAWNVRAPYLWTPAPVDQPFISNNMTRWVLRLAAAPADSLTMNSSMIVEEIG